jgi:hypothetical protein
MAVRLRRKKRWYVIAARPVTTVGLPLDVATGAAAAYSTRKLRTAYAGAAINVRRSSDSTAQDIGFVGNSFDAASFTSFIGGGNGFEAIAYDQSGNANNMAQATAANQCQVQQTLAFYAPNSAQGDIKFLAAPDAAPIQNIFATGGLVALVLSSAGVGFVNSIASKTAWVLFSYAGGGGPGNPSQFYFEVKAATTNGVWPSVETFTAASKHVITLAWNAATPTVAPVITVDGGAPFTFSGYTLPVGAITSDVGGNLELFNDQMINANNSAFGGTIYEAVFYKSIPSNQAALITSMKSFYGIP